MNIMTDVVSNVHPSYAASNRLWVKMRDFYIGEDQVKAKGPVYLPMTTSQIIDGADKGLETVGHKAYTAYKDRARFKNFLRESVQTALGMMHSQPPEIKLPDAMLDIRSSKGETMPQLLRRINMQQLLIGRIGILADIPINPPIGKDLPTLSCYLAETILNWDDGESDKNNPQSLNLVVLDESQNVRTNHFTWEHKDRYRVLTIGKIQANEGSAVYRQGVFDELNSFVESGLMTPGYRGRNLDFIPFVIINSQDITPEIDEPPMLDLANQCLAMYRGDADYRQNLHMQGQDTFVTMGGNFEDGETIRVGVGARIDLPENGKAEYVGVKSSGLAEQREALARLESLAGSMGSQTLDTTSRERESGESLRIRVAARTCDLNQIADAGAEGLQTILRHVAVWIGEKPENVIVKPNKEFGEIALTGQMMTEMATAKESGWPISLKTMHTLSKKRRITNMSFEEEVAQINKEVDMLPKPEPEQPEDPPSNDRP